MKSDKTRVCSALLMAQRILLCFVTQLGRVKCPQIFAPEALEEVTLCWRQYVLKRKEVKLLSINQWLDWCLLRLYSEQSVH